MFLAYIGGLFLILSENKNDSTSHKKIKKIYIICFFKDSDIFFIFPGFFRIFCDLYSHFRFLTKFKKVRQYTAIPHLVRPPLVRIAT